MFPRATGTPMPTVPHANGPTPAQPFAHEEGDVPLPGYTLIEPLGRGGFGEVWKCEAPGGLHKAVKFVRAVDGGGELQQELGAFEQIKAIRHPFLLTLERVELVGDELVMVMELADRQLLDRFVECNDNGLPGIPRAELLGYLADAAEALDMIAARFGLQHLDVKPANLFLTSGRVKVGDYGLVSRLEQTGADGPGRGGMTPKYVSPECLTGRPSPRSDQYSLALVYQELLTGTFPYPAKNPRALMLQHVGTAPDLSGLPEYDREAVGKALAKKPDERFASCLEFVRALFVADPGPMDPALAVRQARVGNVVLTPGPVGDPATATKTHSPLTSGALTQNFTLLSAEQRTVANRPLPQLVTAARKPAAPAPAPEPHPHLPVAEEAPDDRVRLAPIKSVVPVARLLGHPTPDPFLSPEVFAIAVVDAALAGERLPAIPGDLGRTADGAFFLKFPSTVAGGLIPLKLQTVAADFGMGIEQPAETRVVLKKAAPGSLWGSLSGRKAGGLEVTIHLGSGRGVGEMVVVGKTFGTPDATYLRSAADALPKIVGGVRRELQNVEDRRKHPRVVTDLPVTLYPLHSDGAIDPPVAARCRDVSAGGIGFALTGPLPTRYAYAAFDGVPLTAGSAILLRLVRKESQPGNPEYTYGAAYRTDL